MRIDVPTFPTGHTATSEAYTAELLASATAAGDSSVAMVIPGNKRHFTSYHWFFTGLKPASEAAANDLEVRVSFDGGATFETGSTDYEYYTIRFGGGSAANNASVGDNSMIFTDPGLVIGLADGESISGMIWSHNLGDADNLGYWWANMQFLRNTGGINNVAGAGHYDKGARDGTGYGQANALQFIFLNTEITRGEFQLYGIM